MILRAKPISVTIFDIAACYILVWTITPAMANDVIYRIILIICTTVCFILKGNLLLRNPRKALLGCILVLGVLILESSANGFGKGISWMLNRGIYVVVAFIGMYYFDYEREKIRSLILLMLLLTIVIAFISLREVIYNPLAMRIATYDYKEGANAYGSYAFVYMSVQLIPIALEFLLMGKHNKVETIVVVAALIISWALVLMSGFTIANIIVVVSVVFIFILNKPNVSKLLIVTALGLLGFLFFKQIANAIFKLLIELTKNMPAYTHKINSLYGQFFDGQASTYALDHRLDYYYRSWSGLIKYPLFGSVIFTGKNLSGGHSVLVDFPSAYGIIVGYSFWWFVLFQPLSIIKRHIAKGSIKSIIIITFVVTTVMTGFLDTFSYGFMWIWYLFLPYVCVKIEDNE